MKKVEQFILLIISALALCTILFGVMNYLNKNKMQTIEQFTQPGQKDTSKNNVKNIHTEEKVSPTISKNHNTLWGAYTADINFTDFQKRVGVEANINAIFVGWNDPFPFYATSLLGDKTLLIFWEQYSVTLDDIISGSSDKYIKQFANDAISSKSNLILAPLHEMNGNDNPWSGMAKNNTPEKVVLTWKHIHDLFPISTDIKWGWAVNNDSNPNIQTNQIQNYYPGDDYVDYVGVDGFNFGNPWETYSEVFSSALNKLRVYKKPIYIFSMACSQGPKKAPWITDALKRIQSDPDISAFVWFNENKEKNWLLWSDPDSLNAFQNGLK
jgi:hypothetical protein